MKINEITLIFYIIIFFLSWIILYILWLKESLSEYSLRSIEEFIHYYKSKTGDSILAIIVSCLLAIIWPVTLLCFLVYYLFYVGSVLGYDFYLRRIKRDEKKKD